MNYKLKILAFLSALQFTSIYAQQPNEYDDYAFMGAQDLYDALEFEAPIAIGYMLGVVDGLKGRLEGDQCFRVPWIETADDIIKETYMNYWLENIEPKMHATEVLVKAMSSRFPC